VWYAALVAALVGRYVFFLAVIASVFVLGRRLRR
jgi:hypothetical protein